MRRKKKTNNTGAGFIGSLIFAGLLLVSAELILSLAGDGNELCGAFAQPISVTPQLGQGIVISVFNAETEELIEMPLEEYVTGSVAAEMPALYDMEALKAQAVCSRTFAVSGMLSGGCAKCRGAAVCTDPHHCQAYLDEDGMRALWGGEYDLYHEKIKNAVNETAGRIMLYGGKPIKALYHSVSGGRTEDAENVFAERLPYLVGVDSPGEENAPGFYDSRAVSLGEAAAVINRKYPEADVSAEGLRDSFRVLSRFESGRVDKVRAGGAMIPGTSLREMFSLNSANFDVSFTGGEIVFDTRGKGHGVGMSQTGANALAKGGAGYEDILLHYYTGITVGDMQREVLK